MTKLTELLNAYNAAYAAWDPADYVAADAVYAAQVAYRAELEKTKD